MKGALTYKDLDQMKRKAAALDEVREFLRERISDAEGLLAVREMVEAAYQEAPCKAGQRNTPSRRFTTLLRRGVSVRAIASGPTSNSSQPTRSTKPRTAITAGCAPRCCEGNTAALAGAVRKYSRSTVVASRSFSLNLSLSLSGGPVASGTAFSALSLVRSRPRPSIHAVLVVGWRRPAGVPATQ